MGAKGSSSVRINIYVDDSAIRKEVKLAAALRDISVSEYCLAAIREKLAREKSTGGTARQPQSLEKAVESGLRSLFVGFETLNRNNLLEQNKYQNLDRDYSAAIRRLHDAGVMINGSFVFGMDDDDETVFDRTVQWAIEQGIETATFHILTPYPSTALYQRMRQFMEEYRHKE